MSVTAHAAALGTCFFLKGLCSTSEVHCFIPVMGKGTPAAQTAGERSCSHFSFAFPEGFAPFKSAGAVRAVIQAELSLLGVVVHQVGNGQRG